MPPLLDVSWFSDIGVDWERGLWHMVDYGSLCSATQFEFPASSPESFTRIPEITVTPVSGTAQLGLHPTLLPDEDSNTCSLGPENIDADVLWQLDSPDINYLLECACHGG